jgi:hypothetical protein
MNTGNILVEGLKLLALIVAITLVMVTLPT